MKSTSKENGFTSIDINVDVKKMVDQGFTMEEIISETLQAHERAYGTISEEMTAAIKSDLEKEIQSIERKAKIIHYGLGAAVVAAAAYGVYRKFMK